MLRIMVILTCSKQDQTIWRLFLHHVMQKASTKRQERRHKLSTVALFRATELS